MARLILLQGGDAIPHLLQQGITKIGRAPDCHIQLQSNMVSREHARVTQDGNQYALVDIGSGNGTFVNGRRLAKDEPVKLNHEDRIKFGPLLLRFEADLLDQKSGPARSDVEVFDDDDSSRIMDTRDQGTGFGILEVQPEAKLKAIIEISRSLAGTVDLEKLLPRILDTLFEIFLQADRGCILLLEESTGEMVPRAIKHRRETEDSSVKLSRTIVNKVLSERQGILSADAANDSQFEPSESIASLSIRSMMCAPMLGLEGTPLGVVNIDTQNPLNQFRGDDLDLLMAVAGQAALSYESARLFASHVEKQKQDNEMRIARGVQQALLPNTLPETDGYAFFASYDAALAVGGDYYDWFDLGNGKFALSFGDVAGKGVPGAMIMSRMSSVVQATLKLVHDITDAVNAINEHMCANAVEGRFVTYVLVILDTREHVMTVVNAGHMSPIIRRPDGTIDELDDEAVGLPIGVLEEYPYQSVQREIAPGETVVLFTDGVDEAMNPAGELYSMDRLRDFIKSNTDSAADLGRAILADVRLHANGRAQNDDITIMTFGRNSE